MEMEQHGGITIREASDADFATIGELALASMVHRASVSPIRDPKRAKINMRDYYDKLSDQGLSCFPADFEAAAFVAAEESSAHSELVGYVLIATNAKDDLTGERQAYILDIAVKPSYRGRGIATRLLQRAEEYARGMGLRYIGLTVAPGNEPALKLYRKLGYIEEWKRLAKSL